MEDKQSEEIEIMNIIKNNTLILGRKKILFKLINI